MGLSKNYTLSRFKSEVRAQTSTLSQQDSGVIELQLNDLTNHAIMNVRNVLDRLVDDQYRVQVAVVVGTSISSGFVTSDAITAGTLYDFLKVSLYSTTYKEIPIYTRRQFEAYRTLYTAGASGDLASNCIATLYRNAAGAALFDFYCGTADGSFPGTTTMTYLRRPNRETTEANTVDLPDRWVPLAIDHCVLLLFRRLSKQPPADAEARVNSTAGIIAQMLNINPTSQSIG